MSWAPVRRARRGVSAARHEVIRVAPGAAVADLARRHARQHLSVRALELDALLHLPRLADANGVVPAELADHEVARLSRRLHALHEPARRLVQPPIAVPDVSKLVFGEVDEALAASVITRLHYLHSPRRESVHLGSYTPQGRLVALVFLSSLDIDTIVTALPPDVCAPETLVVSRVFAFDWAPRNTISHLLAKIEQQLREAQPQVRLLLTYVNPNLGFDGGSYKAANWMLFGHEAGTRYGYLDEEYITDREIAFLSDGERAQVVYSAMPLAPLTIFGRWLQKRDRRQDAAVRLLPRP